MLARNTVLNLGGQILPLLVGLIAIPRIIDGLGVARFGILTLVWAIVLYLTVFDLGLGRATAKFVAEALGRAETQTIPPFVWTAVFTQILLGSLGGMFLYVASPLLVKDVMTIAHEFQDEAIGSLRLLGVSAPFLLSSLTFRGALEAAQRFDLVNLVRTPVGVGNFVVPAIGAALHWQLEPIVLVLVALQAVATLTYLLFCRHIFVGLREQVRFHPIVFRRMFRYGGWITISDVISPLLVYVDRFVIVMLLSASAVAYYTAPFEIVTRLWIVPASLLATMFPAFSTLTNLGNFRVASELIALSVKYLLLVQGALVIALVVYAGPLLEFWLGNDFATRGTHILQILAAGLLVNTLAQVFYSFIQASGRSDITAKFHLVELLVYVCLVWAFVSSWGLLGAALAWLIRVSADCLLLVLASYHLFPIGRDAFSWARISQIVVALLGLLVSLLIVSSSIPWAVAQTIAVFSASALFAAFVWTRTLSQEDRTRIAAFVFPRRGVA